METHGVRPGFPRDPDTAGKPYEGKSNDTDLLRYDASQERTFIVHRDLLASAPAPPRVALDRPGSRFVFGDATATLTVDDFWQLLRHSGIHDAADCDGLEREYWNADDPIRLARQLIDTDQLTDYQAATLLNGHCRNLAFGDYVAEELLGTGSVATVLRGRHRQQGTQVALKVLSPTLIAQPQFETRFRREFAATCHFEHPNLVRGLDLFQTPETLVLVMELVQGRTLAEQIRRTGPLEVPVVVEYIKQAADGLADAHRAGVIHRDIKPANLLIDDAGRVRVLDFGLATSAVSAVAQRLTSAEVLLGTPQYMAPEQCLEPQAVGPEADVYALGCVLYFLLVGTPPYSRETVQDTLRAHQDDPITRLGSRRDDVPAALEQIYIKMLQKQPRDRWASMDELREALDGG